MKKFIYRMACKIIEISCVSEVVSFEKFDKAEDLLERAYKFYLTSNRKESEEAYIEGLSNMAKLFIEEKRIKSIFNRIFKEVQTNGKSTRNL